MHSTSMRSDSVLRDLAWDFAPARSVVLVGKLARGARLRVENNGTVNATEWVGTTMLNEISAQVIRFDLIWSDSEVDAQGELLTQYVSECTGRPLNAHPFEVS